MSANAYGNAVRASLPLAYWPLTDPAGSRAAVDVVGGRSFGAWGVPTFAVPDPWGQPGACRFGTGTGTGIGGDQLISPFEMYSAPSSSFTIELWYKVTNPGVLVEFNQSTTVAPTVNFPPVLTMEASGHLRGQITTVDTSQVDDPDPSMDETWHHAVFLWDGLLHVGRIIRDGQIVGTNTTIVSRPGITAYWRAGYGYRLAPVNLIGDLAHVAVYDRALSLSEVQVHLAARDPAPQPEPGEGCVRTAWLEMGSLKVALEDRKAGYFCESLDIGYPSVREVTNNRPDHDGTTDRTKLMGSRAVTAAVRALEGAGAVIDEVASSFGPFMLPSARPVLHYVLERPGAAERTLTLRPANYDWPIVGPYDRAIALSWVAPDPIVYGTVENVATAWAGTGGINGRHYDLTFDRTYLAGTGGPVVGVIASPGDLPVQPYLRIYGPITGPVVNFQTSGHTRPDFSIPSRSSARIDAGHFVAIDTRAHTAFMDDNPAQPWLNQLDWPLVNWPLLPPEPAMTVLSLSGTVTTGLTQVQATWRDGYVE